MVPLLNLYHTKLQTKGRQNFLAPPKYSTRIAKLIHSHSLVDIWRELNPFTKDYTHFPALHCTCSRIDHIFLSATAIPCISKSLIRDSPLSDNALVLMYISKPQGPHGFFKWCINEALLSDPIQTMILSKELETIFDTNDTEGISPVTLWATNKAIIRGKLIQITSQHKWDKRDNPSPATP